MTDPRREPTAEELANARRVRRLREPRYTRFLLTGAALGLVAAVVLTLFAEPTPQYGRGAVLGYVGTLLAALGAMLGGLAAVLLDRRRGKG